MRRANATLSSLPIAADIGDRELRLVRRLRGVLRPEDAAEAYQMHLTVKELQDEVAHLKASLELAGFAWAVNASEVARLKTLKKVARAIEAEAEVHKAHWVVEGLVTQFACWSDGKNPGFVTGGLSALEDAFDFLGWDEPHFIKECCCDEPGCRKQATCGIPTKEKYRSVCGDHYSALSSLKEGG